MNEERKRYYQFRLWQLNESILHLGDVYERCNDPDFKASVKKNIQKYEAEKQRLIAEYNNEANGREV